MAFSDLPKKEQAFVNYYLSGWDGAKAARQAGYPARSARQIAYELLTKPDIAHAINERLMELKLSADEVLKRLGDIARGTMEDFVDENLNFDFKKAQESGKLHLVKKFIVTERTFKGETTVRKELELYDAQAALNTLAKHHALLTDRLKVDDWRSEAVELIRKGTVLYPALAEEFGDGIATELFKQAGVPVA